MEAYKEIAKEHKMLENMKKSAKTVYSELFHYSEVPLQFLELKHILFLCYKVLLDRLEIIC